MRSTKLYHDNKGFSLEDWLSPEEVKKLIKALKKSKGWTHSVIAKNIDLKLDYYYVNGELIFERKIK